MLFPRISFTAEYKKLVEEVRHHRSQMTICPSAQEEIDVPKLLETIIDDDVYRSDYNEITTYFQNQPVEYEEAITVLRSIIKSGMFSK